MDRMPSGGEGIMLKGLVWVAWWLLALGMAWSPAMAAEGRGGTLRIGMTAADIPYTGGQPDQGFEGWREVP